jgi:hypothetical protein
LSRCSSSAATNPTPPAKSRGNVNPSKRIKRFPGSVCPLSKQ